MTALHLHSRASVAYGPIIDVLREAATRGADFRVNPNQVLMRPLDVLTDAERAVLVAAKADEPSVARELVWRVEAMRRQVPQSPAPIPALLARLERRSV